MKRATVLGAGIAGLATAYELARRGFSVVVYEQFSAFHDRGSSHGRSRIVRRAYTDRQFTAAMLEAYPMWAELEAALGETLIREVGLLYFGRANSADLLRMAKDLADLEIPHAVAEGDDVRTFSPRLRLDPDEVAIWTPDAGWVDAAATLRGLFRLALDLGVEFRFESSLSPDDVRGLEGPVAICAGPWVREFVDLDVKVTMQTFAYADLHVEGPVWIEDSALLPYGFPSDAWGMKLALHSAGPILDPDAPRLAPTGLDALQDVVARRFDHPNAELSHVGTCLYTSTPDEGFRFGTLGDNAVYVSACSGHAFKFGPWIGRQMAIRIAEIA